MKVTIQCEPRERDDLLKTIKALMGEKLLAIQVAKRKRIRPSAKAMLVAEYHRTISHLDALAQALEKMS